MFINQNCKGKILKVLIWVLVSLTVFFSLSVPQASNLYFFLLLFILAYWQKHRLRKLLIRPTRSVSPFFIFLLVTTFWAAILELTLARFVFHPNPIISFIISLGFYLPYFAIWYKLISRFKFSFLEVFYLSGLSGVLFGLIITKQILIPFAIHTNLKIALLAFGGRIMATLVIWSALTALPSLLLVDRDELLEKPLKAYLFAIISTVLALPFFLIWSKSVNLLLSVLR